MANDPLPDVDREIEVWDPIYVQSQLERSGVSFPQSELPVVSGADGDGKVDPELRDLEKLIRYFMRSTHISEGVILMKLGSRGRCFLDEVLPNLVASGVLTEIDNRGGSSTTIQTGADLGGPKLCDCGSARIICEIQSGDSQHLGAKPLPF